MQGNNFTYLNMYGKPMIRRCENCVAWRGLTAQQQDAVGIMLDGKADNSCGYCTKNKVMFAYTRTEMNFFISRPFNTCYNHEFNNEQVLLKDARRISFEEAQTMMKEVST